MSGLVDVTSIRNAEHYTWGDNCDGWFLLKDANIHIIQERMPPGTREKLHVHNRSRQYFYVLQGELTIILGKEKIGIQAGEGLEVKPRVAHQASNFSRIGVEFIVISTPPSHDDRMNLD